MMPQGNPGPFPPSGQHPAMAGPPPSNPMGWGPPPDAAMAFGPPMQQHAMMQGAAPWAPPSPPPTVGGIQINRQIMLLVGVGVVCLAIFVVGLVLFFTTKF